MCWFKAYLFSIFVIFYAFVWRWKSIKNVRKSHRKSCFSEHAQTFDRRVASNRFPVLSNRFATNLFYSVLHQSCRTIDHSSTARWVRSCVYFVFNRYNAFCLLYASSRSSTLSYIYSDHQQGLQSDPRPCDYGEEWTREKVARHQGTSIRMSDKFKGHFYELNLDGLSMLMQKKGRHKAGNKIIAIFRTESFTINRSAREKKIVRVSMQIMQGDLWTLVNWSIYFMLRLCQQQLTFDRLIGSLATSCQHMYFQCLWLAP